MIHTIDLTKSFGDTIALDGVTIDVPAHTVFGLLGPNGSGQTTLVRILTTLDRPDFGMALVGGRDVVHDPSAVRSLIGVTVQEHALDLGSTGRENLELVAELSQMTRRGARRRAQQLLERFDLADVADDRAATFSGGMRRRLDLAASLVARPTVLFLEGEPVGSSLGRPRPPRGRGAVARRGVSRPHRSASDPGANMSALTHPELGGGATRALRDAWIVARRNTRVLLRTPALTSPPSSNLSSS